MPNRYIKESCTTSPTLAALSDAGERLFWRLTTVADDYGRFDANPAVLFGRCVPTLDWTVCKVEQAFSELCIIARGEESPLVLIYRVKGRLYGCLTNWKEHQRDRSKDQNPPKPKHPGPEAGLIVPPQFAADCGGLRQLAALNESESDNDIVYVMPPTPQLAASEATDTLEVDFETWWKAMPANKDGKRLYKEKALEFYKALKPDERPLALSAAKAYASHCRNADRTACDPMRFLKGQKGELWREFIPTNQKLAPNSKVAALAQPREESQEFCPPPPEALAAIQRLGLHQPNRKTRTIPSSEFTKLIPDNARQGHGGHDQEKDMLAPDPSLSE